MIQVLTYFFHILHKLLVTNLVDNYSTCYVMMDGLYEVGEEKREGKLTKIAIFSTNMFFLL